MDRRPGRGPLRWPRCSGRPARLRHRARRSGARPGGPVRGARVAPARRVAVAACSVAAATAAARSTPSLSRAASDVATSVAERLTAASATPIRPGLLSPRSLRSARLAARLDLASAVRRSAAEIEPARRSRIVASLEMPVRSAWRTKAVPRNSAALDRPVSSARRASTAAGSLIDAPSIVSVVVGPLGPNVRLTRPDRLGAGASVPAGSASMLKSIVTAGLASAAAPQVRNPSALTPGAGVSPSSMASARVDLPASLGPLTMVRPGARATSRAR